MKDITTTKLLSIIRHSKNFDELKKRTEEEITNPNGIAFLKEQLEHANLTPGDVAKEALMDRSFTYQLINGTRNPNRNVLLRFAFVLHLSLEDTQRLLTLFQKGTLYPRILRDAIIIFSLEKKSTLMDTNELLLSIGESPIFKEEI